MSPWWLEMHCSAGSHLRALQLVSGSWWLSTHSAGSVQVELAQGEPSELDSPGLGRAQL